MIDISQLRERESRESIAEKLARRGVAREDVERTAELDRRWRELSQQVEDLRAKKNEANNKIAGATQDERDRIIAQMKEVDQKEDELSEELDQIAEQRDDAWRALPNVPMDDVPGGGEEDFVEIAHSEIEPATDAASDYLTLAGSRIDTERAAKVSGSRFAYLQGELARLEMALVSFAMDRLTGHGFTPTIPPVLVKERPMRGMGYLEHEGDEIYQTQDDLYLVGTSEQSLGPMHMDEMLPESALPLRYAGFSTCFRREAGSYGKDVKGILRVHQFDKVEMFSLVQPNASSNEHEFLLERQREIMDALELPYRVVNIATGDLGAPAAKKYDIETWIPSEGRYRETSSASNTTDYQARRLDIRTRIEEDTVHVHMLNGTAVAVGRILIALLENHQQEDGSVRIPEALHPYMPLTTIPAVQ